jgi:hypothetical protein
LTFDPSKVKGSLANAEPILIGKHPDTTLDCHFRGLIRDVRIYCRALTAAEVEAVATGTDQPRMDAKKRE